MNILSGFTFAGQLSAQAGIYLDTPTRELKPAVKTNEYTIPGRDGTLDYGGETYEKVSITVPIAYKATKTESLRDIARNLAMFFSKRGDLVFDDEPDKAYRDAKVISAPTITEIINIGSATIVFEAQPFLQSLDYHQQDAQGVSLPHDEQVVSNGTVETPCLIYITAQSTITGLTITKTARK